MVLKSVRITKLNYLDIRYIANNVSKNISESMNCNQDTYLLSDNWLSHERTKNDNDSLSKNCCTLCGFPN